jgi:hypothetical protein
MSKIYLALFLLFIRINSFAQTGSDDYLKSIQDSLKPLSKVILDTRKAEEERLSANTSFTKILKRDCGCTRRKKNLNKKFKFK